MFCILLVDVILTVFQASIHSIKNRFSNITSLREFFVAKYQENSPTFKLAQVMALKLQLITAFNICLCLIRFFINVHVYALL